MSSKTTWSKISWMRWSTRSLLVFTSCLAAFFASYQNRISRMKALKGKSSIALWSKHYAMPNIRRLPVVQTLIADNKFVYPRTVAFYQNESPDKLFALLPICDGMESILWQRSALSNQEAKQIAQESRCIDLHLRFVDDCSEMFPQLGRMDRLRKVAIDTCKVTDADLEWIAKAKQLQVILLFKTGCSQSQIQFLRNAMPETYVICMDSN